MQKTKTTNEIQLNDATINAIAEAVIKKLKQPVKINPQSVRIDNLHPIKF